MEKTVILTRDQVYAIREISRYVEMADYLGVYEDQNVVDDGYAEDRTIASLTIDDLREVASIGGQE